MNIENKTVLITGANRGIGQALVVEALRRGAQRVYAGTRGGSVPNIDKRVVPITLDVTNAAQIKQAAQKIDTLDVLINNAGIAINDDLRNSDIFAQHLAVNLTGPLNVSIAFIPQLVRAKGALVTNLSLAGVAPLPMVPSYSISKAGALNMMQALRMLLASQGVTVHAVILGPVDTEMSRSLDVPKTPPALAARGIYDGLVQGEEEIFPDAMSQGIAAGWRASISKALEGQFKGYLQPAAAPSN